MTRRQNQEVSDLLGCRAETITGGDGENPIVGSLGSWNRKGLIGGAYYGVPIAKPLQGRGGGNPMSETLKSPRLPSDT